MPDLTSAPPFWKPLLRDCQRALQAENKSPRTIRTYVDAALRLARRYPTVDPAGDASCRGERRRPGSRGF